MVNVPLSSVAPIRISGTTPNGVFLSHKASDPLMLTWIWEGNPYVLRLEGQDAFRYYPIKAGYSARGSIINDIEFIVDLSSRYDAVQQSDPLGALVLQDGSLYVVAVNAADQFADPVDVELWGDFPGGSKDEKVGFARWSIALRDGDQRIPLWSAPHVEEAA